MPELIDKWAVVNKLIDLENEFQHFKPFQGFENAMYRKICNLEIAIGKTKGLDLVRCKDCQHMKNRFGARYCEVWCMFNGMGDDGFCNYGVRKNG